MILVDSSVWIDQLADRETRQTMLLRQLLQDGQDIGIGDLVMAEVLQGTRGGRTFAVVKAYLDAFTPVQVSDHAIAETAARYYRALRGRGITIRKTIDTLIATRCIVDRIPLLYSDRDFDPFAQHLGLRSAMGASGLN